MTNKIGVILNARIHFQIHTNELIVIYDSYCYILKEKMIKSRMT